MKALIGLLLLVFGHDVSSVIHSLQVFQTASSGLSTFPEYVMVSMVDEVQIEYYDSNTQRIITKQDWADQDYREDPDSLERDTENRKDNQQVDKGNIGTLKKRFNQTGGAHIIQRMYGCEWDDEDGTTEGYEQHGYDGEDFLSLDLKTLIWVAPVHQAFPTKLRLDHDTAYNQYLKNYFNKECVDELKKYLVYGKSTLQRTERPRVSLLRRSPSSPVVCHATGFCPNRVVVFWRRDGQELHEQVDPGEVLPNHDGTFQVSVDLDLTAVPQEDWGRYECVVQLKGIEDIFTPLDPVHIRTNRGKTGVGGDGGDKSHILAFILTGVAVLAVVAAVAVFLYRKRNDSEKRKPDSDTSSENTEGQKLAPEYQPLSTGQS
ncbi:major histocompatibility complex class I-related gene protein [Gadus morhua]|nr:major histocompatibility complex class I-related gene protein-like [Gadus morhua]